MKKIPVYLAAALIAASAVSCQKENSPVKPDFDITVTATAENERPVATIVNNTDYFFPCQVKIDGSVNNSLGIANQIIQAYNKLPFTIKLPYLTPGEHQITLVIGNGRALYRDAEAAWGENVLEVTRNITVKADPKVKIVLKDPVVDKDLYEFIPEDNYGYQNSGQILETEKNILTLTSGIYTVEVLPKSLNNEFEISNLTKYVKVNKVTTGYGNGIEIGYNSEEVEKDKHIDKKEKEYNFDISAGGQTRTIKIESLE